MRPSADLSGAEMTCVCKRDRGSQLSADSEKPVAAPRLDLDRPVCGCHGGAGRRRSQDGRPAEEPVFLAEAGRDQHMQLQQCRSGTCCPHTHGPRVLLSKGSLIVIHSRSSDWAR